MIDNRFCVLVVDDEVRMTRALRDFFRSKDFHVLIANNGQEALDIYYSNNEKIDIILLDVMMPVLDGFAVLSELKSHKQEVPVIMLTAKSEESDELDGFNAGVYDYITKPFSPTVLFARVENILKRVGRTLEQKIEVSGITLDINNFSMFIDSNRIDLKKREFDLLYFLILNKNIVLSRDKILTSVWGYNFDGDVRTVDTHIKQLRIKLLDKSSLIKTVHRVGYIFEVIE
ncbi:MAG: response regulator transcription factor [Clostridia bacterium]